MRDERRIHGWTRLGTAIVSVIALGVIALPGLASATLPGANGRIVFDRDPGTATFAGIFAVNPDGSHEKTVLLEGAGGQREPAVAPSGARITYTSSAADPDIRMLTFGGGSTTPVTNSNGADDGSPVFTPNGTRILYHSAVNIIGGGCCEIMSTDLSDPPDRLTLSSSEDLSPDPSPGGTRIAYSSDGQLWTMDAADGTGGDGPLTLFGGVEPSFSPDGTKIAFASDRAGSSDIYVMNADGSGETQLTNGPAQEQGPSFSPDGTKIAYASGPGSDGGDIYVMNADGSGKTAIVSGPDYVDDDPYWAPLRASYGVTEDGVPGDTDGDGVPDSSDAFPLEPAESADTDGDGTGDAADPDDDGDGVPDGTDAFPRDPAEHADADSDGIGDVADTDDDNDGVPDADDAYPLDPGKSIALTVKAKGKQKYNKLFVRVGCGASACTVKASGKAKVKPRGKRKGKAKGKRAANHVELKAKGKGKSKGKGKRKGKAKTFKLKAKPKRAKIKAGKAKKIRLVVKGKKRKQLGRMLKRGKGSARIKLKARTPAGAKVRAKVKVKLKR